MAQPHGRLHGRRFGQHLHPALDRSIVVLGMDEVERAMPHHVCGIPAQDPRGRLVHLEEDRHLVLAHAGDARGRGLDLLETCQRGHVSADDDPDVHAVAGASVQVVDHRRPARIQRQADLGAGAARRPHAFPGRDDLLAVVGDHEVERRASLEYLVASQWNRGRHGDEDPVGVDGRDERGGVFGEQCTQGRVESLRAERRGLACHGVVHGTPAATST